jgi:acyl carrier protein
MPNATPLATEDEIRARVRNTLSGCLGETVDDVADAADLRETLGERYDSLAAMECISAVENTFSIEVDFVVDDVRYWFATVDRIVQFVTHRLEDSTTLAGGAV